jgi:tetratricopeptide (TPR) repeat protein
MNKVIFIFWILIIPVIVTGQQSVDYLLKARAFRETGNADASISLITRALIETSDSRLYLERAEAYINKGYYSDAIRDFNEANKLIPLSGEYGLSRIYSLKGDPATSLYHLELNLNSSFRKTEKEVMLDPSFGVIENRPEWRQFWKKERYSTSEKAFSEIEYDVSSGKIEDSKTVLSELKGKNGSNEDILYYEALINLTSGKIQDAVRTITTITLHNPDNEKYLRLLARAQTEASNPSGASVTYSHLIDLGVADAELFMLRAECYRKTGENVKAITDVEKYLSYYPESKNAISLAGKIESASGDNLKSLEYFSENIKLHPNDAVCYVDRAGSYFIARSWGMAINDYSMSLDLNPGNADAWLNKGISLINTGKSDDGCHDFRKAFSLGSKRAADYLSKYCIK